jgi:isopentenyldiphosphate isomerase
MSEILDLVDSTDKPIGKASLRECLARGLRHRAVAVVVVRRSGNILLQRRSRKDPWQPGKWTLSCTGHVKQGEDYLSAASRELAEELGLHTPLHFVGKFFLPRIINEGLVELEVVGLLVSRSDSPVSIDTVELEEAKEFSCEGLTKLLGGRALTPDAKVLLRKLLKVGAICAPTLKNRVKRRVMV